MENKLKKIGYENIVTALCFAIFGIVLMCFPEVIMKFIDLTIGVLFVLFGIVKIVNYYSIKGKYDLANYDVFYGLISIILGVIAIFFGEKLNNVIRTLIGVWIIYSGIMKFIFATKIRTANKTIGNVSLLISIMVIICGIFALLYENSITVTLGIILLVYSVMEIVTGLIYVKNINNLFNVLKK